MAATPREEGRGAMVGGAASDSLGEQIRGLPCAGGNRCGRRREAAKPTGRPTHQCCLFCPRSHKHPPHLDGIPTAFLPMPGSNDTPHLTYPTDLPWSAIFFPLGSLLHGGGGRTHPMLCGPYLSRIWWEYGLVLFCWKRADPGACIAPHCLGGTFHNCFPV